MHDPRVDQLARQLVRYSTQVKKGDFVWIDCFDVPNYVAQALVRAVVDAKGRPRVSQNSMDTVADRDLFIEFATACALFGVHMSRIAEDLGFESEWVFDHFTTVPEPTDEITEGMGATGS